MRALALALLLAAPLAAGDLPVGSQFAVAIESDKLEKVKALVEAGNKADTPIEYGEHVMTPLMKACWDGRMEIAKYLLSAGADVHAKDSDNGQTPLMYAVQRGRADFVKWLIDSGAGVNLRDVRKFTPLHVAAAGGHEDVVDFLVKAKADLNAEMYGLTPMMMAASSRNPAMVVKLAKLGASVNYASKTMNPGNTAIFSAILAGDAEMVKTLVDLKANVNARKKDGETPLKAAKKGEQEDIVAILKAAGAK